MKIVEKVFDESIADASFHIVKTTQNQLKTPTLGRKAEKSKMYDYYLREATEAVKARPDCFRGERRHSARTGIVGLLVPDKSIYGGPTLLMDIGYSPGHLRRAEALEIARIAIALAKGGAK